MAGIGFELRKLFYGQGLFSSIRAYTFSSITTIGPMVLCMVMIVAMQWMMEASNAPFLERELFLATVVYCFIFSVLITGGLSMVLTRFIADRMYEKKYEHLLSSYYGSIAVCLPIGAVSSWLFLRGVDASLEYKIGTYLLFAELIVIWLQTVYLSALKDYARIVRHFFFGVGTALAGAWMLLRFSPLDDAFAVVAAMDAGFFVLLLLSNNHFEQVFPAKESRIYFAFLTYFKKYSSLFFIGTFFYSGVYIHSFVYWFGPEGFVVANGFHISPFYDLPVFYAYLTVIPTLVTFVVSVETNFYEKFKNYYARILGGGTLVDIERAKADMQKTLVQEVSFIMEVQLLFTMISLALGIKLLPRIGFTIEQLDTFTILVLGYFLFIMTFIVLLILLYYDDRKGVLIISGLLVAMNGIATYWTMLAGYDGLGMFLASLLALILALARLVFYVRNIDYYTFCSQPITVVKTKKEPFWRRWKNRRTATMAVSISAAVLLTACQSDQVTERQEEERLQLPVQEMNYQLVEDKRLYDQDDDQSVDTFYVTILPTRDGDRALSWYGINQITDRLNKDELDVIIQEGALDGSGPLAGMFGYDTNQANATIRLRGASSRLSPQKSYKIRLNNQAGLWKNQRILNINKHPFDESRIRNKLSFDLFESIPNIASLRTQFVQLYVKDLSEGGSANRPFENYGLFTHVENPNEMYLRSHRLDPYGQLYKPQMFEFFRYPEQLKLQSDPAYDKAVFESVMEIQGREDHAKLLKMLDDVNDMTLPFEQVFETYFDRENFLTWMACNILMDNMDTNSQNYLLYSPQNSDKWYFLPWDYDGGWGKYDGVPSIDSPLGEWQYGISNYWGNTLHRRFFQNPDNVDALGEKIRELEKQFSPDRIGSMIQGYSNIVDPFIQRQPDIGNLPLPVNEVHELWESMAWVPKARAESFFRDLEKPMPIFLADPVVEADQTTFSWERSFDFQGDDLTYEWVIARDPLFQHIVDRREGMFTTELMVGTFPKGTYYWRVTVRDAKGNLQYPFDSYQAVNGDNYHGMRQWVVNGS